MKNQTLKNKMKNNKITLGSWITIPNNNVAEILSRCDFDWLTIDMEHSVISLDVAQNMIEIIENQEIVPLVRVGENNSCLIKQVMDSGAHGVIVPKVNSRIDAEKAVKSVKYPPMGFRGVGLARAQKFGFGFEEYKNWLEKESIVIVQIEHIEGVKNIDEILDVKGVDGFIVGPYDLSGSLGAPGDFNTQEFINCIKKLIKASEKHIKPAGIHVIPPDFKEVLKYINYGYKFIGVSLDTLFLGSLCNKILLEIKNEL